MRFAALAFLVGAVLTTNAMPAEAQGQWKSYVSRDFGFSFAAPGVVKAETATSLLGGTGEHPAVVFRSVVNNIEYKATVVDFNSQVGDGASLLLEAAYNFQNGKKVLMDIYAGIANGDEDHTVATLPRTQKKDDTDFNTVRGDGAVEKRIFGRKITIELPNNGGRAMAAFYFNRGYLIQAKATVLPANGDYASPDVPRFIDSVAFQLRHMESTATVLKLPD